MSSANSFRFEDRPTDESSMSTKRIKRSNIVPCSTSASTSTHEENCLSEFFFCYLEFNKSIVIVKSIFNNDDSFEKL